MADLLLALKWTGIVTICVAAIPVIVMLFVFAVIIVVYAVVGVFLALVYMFCIVLELYDKYRAWRKRWHPLS